MGAFFFALMPEEKFDLTAAESSWIHDLYPGLERAIVGG
jgi:hypothetical protein